MMRSFSTDVSPVWLLIAVLVGCAPEAGEGTADAAGEDYVARMAIEHADDEPVPSEAAAADPTSEIATETPQRTGPTIGVTSL